MRKIDIKKIERIRKVLKENPGGLWIREIARKSGLDKSTVSIYIKKFMRSEIKIKKIGNILKMAELKK